MEDGSETHCEHGTPFTEECETCEGLYHGVLSLIVDSIRSEWSAAGSPGLAGGEEEAFRAFKAGWCRAGMLAARQDLERSARERLLAEVDAERDRQHEKWGEQNHDPITWSAILSEEAGELAQAALQARFEKGDLARVREEAIQAAAVALQIVECLDRDRWNWAIVPPLRQPGSAPSA